MSPRRRSRARHTAKACCSRTADAALPPPGAGLAYLNRKRGVQVQREKRREQALAVADSVDAELRGLAAASRRLRTHGAALSGDQRVHVLNATYLVADGRADQVRLLVEMGRDLVALVLTVVELLRQLMERQAIRRVEQGDLNDEQVEEIGTTLMLLDQRMKELCEQHGVRPEDLNLDLGPLGTLLPHD